jgi:Zn-dependent metalloprotease
MKPILGPERIAARAALVIPLAFLACKDTRDDGGSAAERLAASGATCATEAFGGHQYAFCNDHKPFGDARAACEAAGGHLVSIDSAGEDVFVHAHATQKAWIGGAFSPSQGDWRWLGSNQTFWRGGDEGSPPSGVYTNWAGHEPNNQEHHSCAGMNRQGGRWNAWECNTRAAFVCEIESIPQPEPKPDAHCTKSQRNGHDYWFCQDSRGFDDARGHCQGVGMDLATVGDTEENTFVSARAGAESYVGLNDRASEGAWKWLAGGDVAWCGGGDGYRATSGSFASWGSGQPATAHCRYETRAGHGYWFCDDAVTFAAARDACQSVGMTLAKVDDAAEDSFVLEKAAGTTWLGGGDVATEGTWTWLLDGSPFWANQPVAGRYANWKKGEPAGETSANCLVAQKPGGGTWAAAHCEDLNRFVCEGATDGAFPLPDSHDCATIAAGTGRWTAVACSAPRGYVCETVDPDANTTLDQLTTRIRDDFRTGKPRVSNVAFRDNTSVTDPFSRYSDRLGMRACVDAFEPAGPAGPVPTRGTEAIEYRQTYKRIPVHGRGYMVQRDPATRFAKSFTGRAEHDINVDTTPVLSERQAFAKVKEHLHVPPNEADKLSDVTGALAIFAAADTARPPWELAYLFTVPGGSSWRATGLAISAKTGAVLMNMPRARRQVPPPACVSHQLDGTLLQRASVDVNAFQQNFFVDRSNLTARSVPGAADHPLLFSIGVSNDASSPLFEHPRVFSECAGEDYPKVAMLDSNAIIVLANSPEAYRGAAFQMGVQRCLEFYARDLELSPGVPWIGFDGSGTQDIAISMFKGATDSLTCGTGSTACYNGKINHDPDAQPFVGASIELACHELTHGVFDFTAGGRLTVDDVGTRALHEGIADMFGNAGEMSVRGYPGPGAWCMAGDEYDNMSCLIDMRDPSRSTACLTLDTAGRVLYVGCPKEYLGPDYCNLSLCDPHKAAEPGKERDCCEEHHNGTVMSHWAYLVANGNRGTNSHGCSYDVAPLSTDLYTSVTQSVRIVHQALRDQEFSPNTGYPGIAEATVRAAETISPEAARTVTQAWFAANVKDSLTDSELRQVRPRHFEPSGNPWVRFRWPLEPNVTSWDIQVGNGSFDANTAFVFEKRGVTARDILDEDGHSTGNAFLGLSFPPHTIDTWFWRVRPHTDGPWTDCYPIHAFDGTGELDSLGEISILGTPAEEGKIRPGRINVAWTMVGGAERYEVTLSDKGNMNCMPDADSITATFDGFPDDTGPFETSIAGLQPQKHYHLNVVAIGPEDIRTNQPARSRCETVEFDTGTMRAPEVRWPDDGYNSFVYPPRGTTDGGLGQSDPSFRWVGLDGPAGYELLFYEIRADGKTCEDEPLRAITGDYSPYPCIGSSCLGSLEELPYSDPNPSGYCWKIRSIAKNGPPSPYSERRVFKYVHHAPHQLEPGIQGGLMAGSRFETSILPGDSFDQDVTFKWESDPLAATYGLKLGLYPWDTPISAPDPENCWIPLGFSNSMCTSEPRVVTYPTADSAEITGTEITLPGAQAARGRYCWKMWPIPGRSRKPLVDSVTDFCYTSGPQRPEIECADAPADGSFFSGGPVHCTIRSAYIPASQFRWFVNGSGDFNFEEQVTADDEDCRPEPDTKPQPRPSVFGDIYDCEVRLEIRPKAEQEILITGRTWNSDQNPPVLDDASQLPDKSLRFSGGLLPAAPVPIYPLEDSEVVAGLWTRAEWEPVEGATEYRFRVWLDGKFGDKEEFPVDDTSTAPGTFETQAPKIKKFCWAVQAGLKTVDGEVQYGSWSRDVCFLPITPRITIQSPTEGSSANAPLLITWKNNHPPARYYVTASAHNDDIQQFYRSDTIDHDSSRELQLVTLDVVPGKTYDIDVWIVYSDATTTPDTVNNVRIIDPTTDCSPPIVPSIVGCGLAAPGQMTGAAIFKPVAAAIQYDIQWDIGTTGIHNVTVDADEANPMPGAGSCGSAGWYGVGFFTDGPVNQLGYRMRTRTSACVSDWSPNAITQNVAAFPSCVDRGFCGNDDLCRFCWPPGQ